MAHSQRQRLCTPPTPSPRFSDLQLTDLDDTPSLSPSTSASSPFRSTSPDPAEDPTFLRDALAAEKVALAEEKAALAAEKAALAAEKAALAEEKDAYLADAQEARAALDKERAKTRQLRSQLEDERSGNYQLKLLGQGCFGFIYGWPQQTHVYKVTQDDTLEAAETLQREFDLLGVVYQAIGDKRTAAAFISPRPWAYNSPYMGTDPIIADGSPPRPDKGLGYRVSRQKVPDWCWESFNTATMAFDLVPALHTTIQQAYRNLFFGPALKETSPNYWLPVLRLYLGKKLPAEISELPTGPGKIDLKLDCDRYSRLRADLGDRPRLPDLHEIARGMGDVLASLHYGAGIDGRDIELVLAGDRYLQARCYVFDYNQCQMWLRRDYMKCDQYEPQPTTGNYASDDITGAARRLAKLIFYSEYYYPRPRISLELWAEFKRGYELRVQDLIFQHGSQAAIAKQITLASNTFLTEFAQLDQARQGWKRPSLTLEQLEAKNAQDK